MSHRFTIVGLGEALFDILPDGDHLGGAPLNVAVHAHQMGQKKAGRGVVVSRVGQDDLGREVAQELTQRGMDTSWLQTDPDYDTGKVYVTLDDHGQPSYDIVSNAAWDVIQFDPDTEDLARHCDAVAFGTLAQRHPQSRNSILRFLAAAARAIRLFDVNLRQSYYDASILRRSCELATVVKLNRDELPVVCRELGLGDGSQEEDHLVETLLKAFKLKMVALTRGSQGTALYTPSGKVEGEPVSYPAQAGADAVGAGDACTAALLVGMVMRLPPEQLVSAANRAGAYVASVRGATPALPEGLFPA